MPPIFCGMVGWHKKVTAGMMMNTEVLGFSTCQKYLRGRMYFSLEHNSLMDYISIFEF